MDWFAREENKYTNYVSKCSVVISSAVNHSSDTVDYSKYKKYNEKKAKYPTYNFGPDGFMLIAGWREQ